MAHWHFASRLALGCIAAGVSAVAGCAPVDDSELDARNAEELGLSRSAITSVWNWETVAGTKCADGTTTGFGWSQGTGSDVLVFYEGGGACWNEWTCYTGPGRPLADHLVPQNGDPGAYVQATFNREFADPANAPTYAAPLTNHGLFDRNWSGNPFKNASYVYIPYCTGDIYAGSTTMTYASGTKTHYFNGKNNLTAFLPRVHTLFPNPSRLTVSGRSAGGFAAALTYWRWKGEFTGKRIDLIDDSGPPFDETTMVGFLNWGGMSVWKPAWNLNAALPPGCTNCSANIRNTVNYYAQTYTDSKFAILSFDYDVIIGLLFGQDPNWFGSNLNDLNFNVLRPKSNMRYFVPPMTSIPNLIMDAVQNYFGGLTVQPNIHTMVHNLDTTAGSMSLSKFLTDQYNGASTWSNKTPTGVTCPTSTYTASGVSEAKYVALGACGSALGVPTGNPDQVPPDLFGRFQVFQNGSIYWHPNTGSHEIRGAIKTYWASKGYEQSTYGYPTTDQLTTVTANGSKNLFTGGGIYSHPTFGTHGVLGAIWTLYNSVGGDASALGLPLTDEFATGFLNADRRQNFEHGFIYWNPISGATVTYQ